MNKKLSSTAVLLLGALALVGGVQNATAAPGAIFSATSATINSGGPGSGSIADTFNQSGLSASYISDVTAFDPFVATTTHTVIFSGYEWFSNSGTSSASVTYDLGFVRSFDRLALWNEESSGAGTLLDLWTSTDDTTYTPLASLSPTAAASVTDYLAEVFSVGATARYVRFDMSGCPHGASSYPACAIGEVAFRTPEGSEIPEPAMLGLLGLGLVGLVASRRRKAA